MLFIYLIFSLVVTIPAELFHFEAKPEAASITTTSTTATTTSATTTATTTSATTTATTLTTFSEEIIDEDSSLEEVDIEPDEFLPTFASFSQISSDVEKPEPNRFRSPKFIPQPVRTVPIPIPSNSFGPAHPILLNNRNLNEDGKSLEYGS